MFLRSAILGMAILASIATNGGDDDGGIPSGENDTCIDVDMAFVPTDGPTDSAVVDVTLLHTESADLLVSTLSVTVDIDLVSSTSATVTLWAPGGAPADIHVVTTSGAHTFSMPDPLDACDEIVGEDCRNLAGVDVAFDAIGLVDVTMELSARGEADGDVCDWSVEVDAAPFVSGN